MRRIGAHLSDGSCTFTVWAPLKKRMAVHLLSPVDRMVPMECDGSGYWTATIDGIGHGARYRYAIEEGEERPDPASIA